MKALNTLLYSFVRYPEELEAFAEDPPRMAAEASALVADYVKSPNHGAQF